MDSKTHILPYILATLSRKPFKCANIDDLCNEVQGILASEYPNTKLTHIRKAINYNVDQAEGLGIITIAKDNVRLPISFDENKYQAIEQYDDDNDSMDDAEVNGTSKKMATPLKVVSTMDSMGRRRSVRTRRTKRGRSTSRRRNSRRRVSRRRR